MKNKNTVLFMGAFTLAFVIGFSAFADQNSVIGDGVTPKACEVGQLAKLTKSISVIDKNKNKVSVDAGSEAHIIDKKTYKLQTTYKIYVGQNIKGELVSGVGEIIESKERILDCEKVKLTL